MKTEKALELLEMAGNFVGKLPGYGPETAVALGVVIRDLANPKKCKKMKYGPTKTQLKELEAGYPAPPTPADLTSLARRAAEGDHKATVAEASQG